MTNLRFILAAAITGVIIISDLALAERSHVASSSITDTYESGARSSDIRREDRMKGLHARAKMSRQRHQRRARFLQGSAAMSFDVGVATAAPRITATPTVSPTPPPLECADGNQVDYRGFLSVTKDGIPCQKWSEFTPHTHTKTDANFPNSGLGDHNYCRNPDNTLTAWCFTTDPTIRRQRCSIPACPTPAPSVAPSVAPSFAPTSSPSSSPSSTPSAMPSPTPSAVPSASPSSAPSGEPSSLPSCTPSSEPSEEPSAYPTVSDMPSRSPTYHPTGKGKGSSSSSGKGSSSKSSKSSKSGKGRKGGKGKGGSRCGSASESSKSSGKGKGKGATMGMDKVLRTDIFDHHGTTGDDQASIAALETSTPTVSPLTSMSNDDPPDTSGVLVYKVSALQTMNSSTSVGVGVSVKIASALAILAVALLAL